MSGDAAIEIAPLYPRQTRDPVQPWRDRAGWAVAQRIDHPDPEQANRLALLDLEGGADALVLVAAGGRQARGYGLPEPNQLAAALERVELDLIGLRLDAGSRALAFAEALAAVVTARRLGGAGLDIDLGFDPVALTACGTPPEPGAAAALVRLAGEAGLAGRPLLCDGRTWHEAGASEARELALVLATAVSHMRQLEAAGLSLEAARNAIAVLLAFDSGVLVGLAKARAIRRLWARLETACGLQPKPLTLHAETSWRMMTRYDPRTNAMRATAAVFAAGLGGADTVTVLPMTLVQGLPDDAARRLARNTGRVLLDEAALGAVDDPAAGSGALESLTDDLCKAAWTLFQDVERAGGIEAEQEGRGTSSVVFGCRHDRERRAAGIEAFTCGITGTTRFPSLDTSPLATLEVHRDLSSDGSLPSWRDAMSIEALRDKAEVSAAAGRRPRIFLATLGAPAAFGSRANLATHLLAAAGHRRRRAASRRARPRRHCGCLQDERRPSGVPMRRRCRPCRARGGVRRRAARRRRHSGPRFGNRRGGGRPASADRQGHASRPSGHLGNADRVVRSVRDYHERPLRDPPAARRSSPHWNAEVLHPEDFGGGEGAPLVAVARPRSRAWIDAVDVP